jgi:hypothetical protein
MRAVEPPFMPDLRERRQPPGPNHNSEVFVKLFKGLFFTLLVVAVALAVVSQFLPASYRVERNLIMRASGDKIFPLVNEVRKWPEWSAWNTEMDPTLTYTYEGPESGPGAISKWEGKKTGQGMLTITEADPAKGIKYDLSFEHGRYISKGFITFVPAGTDTKLVMGVTGEVSRNPMDRWFSVFMEKLVAPDFEKGLAKLKKVVEAVPPTAP